ncbi:MAG: copper amine oxidase N-terminal domain-containing protein [Lutispora sp.]|nr:copper amine oxidase N-terminal domain-containing protein [Lutispora sp.]MDD4834216.1 copper amine oxidase N-terminal domain-containing protein [Lutispora sp.]
MTMYKFVSRVCAVTIFFTLLAASGVHAVEPWSTDLWKEPAPSVSGSNTGTQQKENSGGGLWSDQLWQNTPPAQPTTPPVEKPKPVQEPKPTDKPLPVNNPDETSNILVMQVENNKALVRGVEKELLVPPTIINGRMMIPLRFIGDALNAAFSWSNAERKTTVELDGKKIELWAGKSIAMVNGNVVQLDTSPVVLDDSTLVPMRFVSENFGYPVEYKTETQTVKIKEPEKTGSKPNNSPSTYVMLQIGNKNARIQDKNIQLDVAPSVIGGRTMVPIRFLGEALNAVVGWGANSSHSLAEWINECRLGCSTFRQWKDSLAVCHEMGRWVGHLDI